jgi:hypothetical protein
MNGSPTLMLALKYRKNHECSPFSWLSAIALADTAKFRGGLVVVRLDFILSNQFDSK